MEYFVYQIEENQKTTDVVAIRQGWGLEEEIYKAVGNAIVLHMMDHLFLLPIHTKANFIPTMPSVVMDGVYYGLSESCQKCVNRTRQLTRDGCQTCVFSPIGNRREFNFNALQRLFAKQNATFIDILSQMEKKSIYEIYHLYCNFRNFYSEELPLPVQSFLSLVSQFDIEMLFSNEHEIYFRKNSAIYQAYIHSEFVDDKLHRRKMTELKEMYMDTREKISSLTQKSEFLQQILK